MGLGTVWTVIRLHDYSQDENIVFDVLNLIRLREQFLVRDELGTAVPGFTSVFRRALQCFVAVVRVLPGVVLPALRVVDQGVLPSASERPGQIGIVST